MSENKPKFLITGGAKRLGALCALELAKRGHDLIIHYQSSLERAEALKKELEPYRVAIHLYQADFNQPDEVEKMMTSVLQDHGPLNGLINNASTFTVGALEEEAHFETMLNVHVRAVRMLSTQFAKAAPSGLIINFIDALIRSYQPRFQNYRLSKLFLTELTRQLALSLAPKIRVNAIAPGPILPAEHETVEKFNEVVQKTPLQLSPGLSGIAHALNYLLDAPYLTGQIIYVDSGQHLL